MGVLDNLLYGSVQYLTRNSALYKVVGAIFRHGFGLMVAAQCRQPDRLPLAKVKYARLAHVSTETQFKMIEQVTCPM